MVGDVFNSIQSFLTAPTSKFSHKDIYEIVYANNVLTPELQHQFECYLQDNDDIGLISIAVSPLNVYYLIYNKRTPIYNCLHYNFNIQPAMPAFRDTELHFNSRYQTIAHTAHSYTHNFACVYGSDKRLFWSWSYEDDFHGYCHLSEIKDHHPSIDFDVFNAHVE